ncbi:MAG: flagellar hook-basal body complex protein FliE [Planctomycetota bacterium]|jgi:flagellar hook-basal body complex protein FliE
MINFDPNVNSILPNAKGAMGQTEGPNAGKPDFANAVKVVGKYISKVDDLQQNSDASIQDLLTGKNNDVTAVVSSVAKADVSFKVLVGVRNKLIEAYKQTMNMQL